MKAGYFLVICSVLGLFISAGCSTVSSTLESPDYWPSEEWLSDDPSNRNIDTSMLDAATERIPEELPFLDSLLLIRDGYLVHESYYNGYDETALHDIR